MSVSREGIPGRLELETSQLRASSSERDADPDMLQRAPRLRMQALRITATTAPQPCHAPALVSGTTGASFGAAGIAGCRLLGVQIWCRQGNLCFLLLIHSDLQASHVSSKSGNIFKAKQSVLFPAEDSSCRIKVWGLRRQICSIGKKRVLGTPWVWHCEGLTAGCCESSVMLPRCQDYLSVLGIDATNRLG